jgi:dipeptidyl aminopeptidase/acylaminoacyl peptidase
MRHWLLAAALLSPCIGRSAEAPPPLEALCEPDQISQPTLSPDGTRIAYIASRGRIRGFSIYHLDTGKVDVICGVVPFPVDFVWKDNNRILSVDYTPIAAVLHSITLGRPQPFDSFPGYGRDRVIAGVSDWLPADPKHILVDGNQRMHSTQTSTRMGILDIDTGEIRETEPVEPLLFANGYVADRTGNLRTRWVPNADGIELQHRRTDSDGFKTAFKLDWDGPGMGNVGFSGDSNVAYFITQDDGDLDVLRAFDTRTFSMGPSSRVPGAVVQDAYWSRDHSRLLGVSAFTKDDWVVSWNDDTMKRIQRIFDASLAGTRNLVVSWSNDLNVAVALSYKGCEPGAYYALDLQRKSLIRLGARRSHFDPSWSWREVSVDIPSRDGSIIHGYLDLPAGGAGGPFPLVLIPQVRVFLARASRGYDTDRAFLTSRGYAVLSVDTRGTWGYGRAYEDAGKHEIAGKIADDVEDAARWSIKSGYASSGRICVFGSTLTETTWGPAPLLAFGFSGTQALIAITRNPELYCCAVNNEGEPDLTKFADGYNSNMNWLDRKNLSRLVGDDVQSLRANSPILAIERIHGPLLNLYDSVDWEPRWDRLEKALKQAGKPYVLFKNLVNSKDNQPIDYRINYYRQIEEFLDRNLKNAPGI